MYGAGQVLQVLLAAKLRLLLGWFRLRLGLRRLLLKLLLLLNEDVGDVYVKGGIRALMEIPGVGKAISDHIEEYLKTGNPMFKNAASHAFNSLFKK